MLDIVPRKPDVFSGPDIRYCPWRDHTFSNSFFKHSLISPIKVVIYRQSMSAIRLPPPLWVHMTISHEDKLFPFNKSAMSLTDYSLLLDMLKYSFFKKEPFCYQPSSYPPRMQNTEVEAV